MKLGWVLVVACVPFACTHAPERASGGRATPGPAWLQRFPAACSLGQSGPTLRPTDAIAEARRKARALLASARAEQNVRAATVVVETDDKTDMRQIVLEQGQGWIRESEIVAMWYDVAGVATDRAAGSAYALACPSRNAPADASTWIAGWRERRAGPSWIFSLPGQRLCVVGLSAPTIEAGDAKTNADDEARTELAQAIALHASSASAVLEGDETLYAAVTTTCGDCAEKAKAGKVAERWFDERGEGPLPYSGTAYTLMCLE